MRTIVKGKEVDVGVSGEECCGLPFVVAAWSASVSAEITGRGRVIIGATQIWFWIYMAGIGSRCNIRPGQTSGCMV